MNSVPNLKLLFILFYLAAVNTFAQEATPYRIFTGEGKKTSYAKMMRRAVRAEVIFFGELHNNALAHWLELQLLKDVHARRPGIVLGMEMFEADDQAVLDRYLQGTIDEKQLQEEARLWSNYKTDYRALVEFAKKENINVVATNIPRRYASLVYKKGLSALDSVEEEATNWMAPLPITVDLDLPGYRNMMAGMSDHAGGDPANLARAQAVKDATMAHFITKVLEKSHGVFHLNGAYHSQHYEGIVWYLKQYRPAVQCVTIHVAEQETIREMNDINRNKADFIICIPADMTKTY